MRDRIPVAVLVSGGGTNLQAIINAEKEKSIKSGKIILVASYNKNAYALERAKNAEIETFIYENENELIKKLKALDVELIVLAGFLRILSPDFIDNFNGKIINIHPALLPSFGGKGCYGIHVHEKALERGVKVSGATVHYVNEVPDGGEIISQKAVSVLPNDTPITLQKRIMEEAEWIILPQAIEDICKNLL